MVQQLEVWQGDFGDQYTDRNVIDWHKRYHTFQQMVGGLSIKRVLEVGCNRGHNLIALSELLGVNGEVIGVEPNVHALRIARAASPSVGVIRGDVFDLPFKDDYFDLVFTAGVLIHISLSDLSKALSEIYRLSKRYILAVEYFAPTETAIHYRGLDDVLWKRDFLKHYQTLYHNLTLVRSGCWGDEDGFDETHWWLLEKSV